MEILVKSERPSLIPSELKSIDFLPEMQSKYRHFMLIYILYIYAQLYQNTHLLLNMYWAVPYLFIISLGYLTSVVYKLYDITFLGVFSDLVSKKLLHMGTKRHEFMRVSLYQLKNSKNHQLWYLDATEYYIEVK